MRFSYVKHLATVEAIERKDKVEERAVGDGKYCFPGDELPSTEPNDGHYRRYLCDCNNALFEVFHTDSYETSVRCKCGRWFVVHSG